MLGQVKSRSFDVTPKRTPRLSTNFLRQTRNFRSPALHLLSFSYNLTFVEKISHTGPRNFDWPLYRSKLRTNKLKAGHLKFLVCGTKIDIDSSNCVLCQKMKTSKLRQNIGAPCPKNKKWTPTRIFDFAKKGKKLKLVETWNKLQMLCPWFLCPFFHP